MENSLTWRTGLASQPWVRFSVSPGSAHWHDHDFVEWFWVDAGYLRNEWTGGIQNIAVGDVVCMHPSHRHRVMPGPGGGQHVVTSIEPSLFAAMRARLQPQAVVWPFPRADQPPTVTHVSPVMLAQLRALMGMLPVRNQTAIDAEFALTGLLRVLATAAQPAAAEVAPAWLRTAIASLDDVAIAGRGVSVFIESCGHGSSVVSRACRTYYHCRPNELVEGARLDAAARWLRSSTMTIEDCAERCGYASLSHFYRAFRKRFAVSPAAFRRSA